MHYSGIYVYFVKKNHVHFRISYTMNAEDIFRSSIGCEIMLMIKARIRLIFSRYTTFIKRMHNWVYYIITNSDFCLLMHQHFGIEETNVYFCTLNIQVNVHKMVANNYSYR